MSPRTSTANYGCGLGGIGRGCWRSGRAAPWSALSATSLLLQLIIAPRLQRWIGVGGNLMVLLPPLRTCSSGQCSETPARPSARRARLQGAPGRELRSHPGYRRSLRAAFPPSREAPRCSARIFASRSAPFPLHWSERAQSNDASDLARVRFSPRISQQTYSMKLLR